MDGCEVSHHDPKCLGFVHSAENLAANSIQFIGYFVCQWEYERGVNALKWNVQPRAVIERNKLYLRGLGFEIHDDVLSEGVLSPDFQHGKQLGEMALGEFGIDGEPELSARLHGSNDSALRTGSGFLRSGHVVSSLGYILQHMYMRLEGHALADSNQMGSREGDAGGVVDSLHGSKGSRMIRNKSNREGGGEKKPARDSLWPSLATARRVSAFPCSCVARITGERAR